jgi:hypothetical protein
VKPNGSKAPNAGCVFLLIVVFALAALGVPANAESLSPFAHDAAGRSVLEF